MSEVLENATEDETVPVVVQPDHVGAIMPIVIFSYIGASVRIGLGFLGSAQAPLSTALWPNFIGCFIMGFAVEQKLRIQTHSPQLYIGLTTGLCGSLTTFSGLMYNSCLALFGPSSHYTYPVLNYLSVTISLLSSSFVGFILGRRLSAFLLSPYSTNIPQTEHLCTSPPKWLFPFISLPVTAVLVLLAALLPIGHNTFVIYSIILAPLGSLTRFTLSVVFNSNPKLPAGTLFANLIGSYIYFGMAALNEYAHTLSPLVKQLTISIMQGYCGCLTTVSTFILEIDTITQSKYSYIYFLLSLLPIQTVAIVLGNVFGSLCSPST